MRNRLNIDDENDDIDPQALVGNEITGSASAETNGKESGEDDTSSHDDSEIDAITLQQQIVGTAGNEASSEEFDWRSLDHGKDRYTKEERENYEKEYGGTMASIVNHQVLDGLVIAMTNKDVVVNINFKSEGIVALSEFRYKPDLKVGDKVEVYVENQEDKNGQLVLSHKKARIVKAWENVNRALGTGEIIQGFVKCRTKGGLIVDVFGIEAFLPGSQIDVKPVRDFDIYVGKNMEFKVVKINKEFKNVVVSHKALIEEGLQVQRREIISKLEKGQVLEGTVKNITSYGVFVDLGGVDGLIHITDLSWARVARPDEVVKLDQKINVVILDFDEAKTRIQLGLKQLQTHPWESIDKSIKVGDKVSGKIIVVADYGAFIEIQPGVEGLIHVSEMSWSQHLRSAHDFLKVGDQAEVMILSLDKEERKMSLGMKQFTPDPWKDIISKYTVGTKHKGVIRNFTNYGTFVELEEGIDGLVHISDLSWSKKIKHPSEFASVGDTLEVVILDVDPVNRKVSLGHKQLEENPWDVFETIFTIDSVHEGTILNLSDKGAIVSLTYGVEAFSPARHLLKADNSKAIADERLQFKVIEFSKENKRIIISHTLTYRKEMEEPQQRKESPEKIARQKAKSVKKAVKEVRKNLEITTLGDIEALSSLKTNLVNQEESQRAEADDKAKAKDPAD